MKNIYKRLIALFLVLLLIVPSSFGLDKKELGKEEVIYAKLGLSGQAELLIAVNGFPKGYKGKDFGNYSDVSNLSTTEELDHDGIKVNIDAKENFYYQGKLDGGQLPWLIAMDWFLDGKKVSEEELLGSSGHLELDFRIEKNPKANPDYFDYYVLQAGFHFDVDQISNLLAPDGTQAAAGSVKMVNFMSLPGRGGSFKLEVDVKDYEPGMIQIAALPLNVGFDMSELSDYTGDLKTLELALSQLNSGTWDFLDGLYQIKEGSRAYRDGGYELLDGSSDLSSGLFEISRGSKEFSQGLGDFSDGMEEFKEGILELVLGLDDMAGGLGQLDQGGRELSKGVEELSKGLRQLVVAGKGGLGEDTSEEEENLVFASSQFLEFFRLFSSLEGIEVSEEDIDTIKEALAFISEKLIPAINSIDRESLEEVSSLIEASLPHVRISVENLKAIRESLLAPGDYEAGDEDDLELTSRVSEYYKSQMSERAGELSGEIQRLEAIESNLYIQNQLLDLFIQALPVFEDDFVEFQRLLGELQKILEELEFSADQVQELLDSLAMLSQGYEAFHGGLVLYVDAIEEVYLGVSTGERSLAYGLGALSDGLSQLYQGMEEFSSAKDELLGGVGELSGGARLFYENYLSLHRGLASLAGGLGEFDSGLSQYIHGFWPLHQGLEDLYSGGLELGRGTSAMADETRDMDLKMIEEIKKEIDNFIGQDVDFKSFVDSRNKKVSSVQFIMLYEGRSLPQEETDQDQEEEKSFWDRFVDLFKKD